MNYLHVTDQIRVESGLTLVVDHGEPVCIITRCENLDAALDRAAVFFGAPLAPVGEPEPTSAGWVKWRCQKGGE